MRRRIIAFVGAIVVVVAGAMVMVMRPAYAVMACTVDYKILREWSNGYWAELTLTNLGAPSTSWYLRFRIAGSGQIITMGNDQLPPGYRLGSGEMYPITILRPPEGETLPTGGSVTVRFGGQYRDENLEPVDYTFNELPCNVDLPSGSPPRSSPPPSTPAPGAMPPSVALTSPLVNDYHPAGATIPIRASATAAAGRRIERVEFRAGTTLLGVDTTAPYGWDWRGVQPTGGTRIYATAVDDAGDRATAEVRGIRVLSPPPPGTAPALKVSGDHIVTVERNPRAWRPRGIVRSTVAAACGVPVAWDGPVDDAAVRALRARGVNAVRMVLGDECWGLSEGDPVARRAHRVAYTDAAVAYAQRLLRSGITPILSVRPTTGLSATSLWLSMAERLGGDNAVVLDVTNPLAPPVGTTDPAIAWDCWQNGGPTCVELGFPPQGPQEVIRVLRIWGSFNVVLAGGLDAGNDLSRWLAHRPADPAGHNVGAAFVVHDRSACATPACFEATLLPLAAQVPVVATDVSAGATAPGFVPRTVAWLDRHGIGHLCR